MIGKLSVLGFALVTAVTSQALAHENHGSRSHRQSDPRNQGAGYRSHASAPAEVDLRYADFNRDGWVTMQEALDSGRHVFQRQDRDNNRILTRREVGYPALRQDDRDNDGRVSMREYRRAVRAQFARLDINRDGYLGRRELGSRGPRAIRSAGWWR